MRQISNRLCNLIENGKTQLNKMHIVKITRKDDPEYFEVNGIEDKDVIYISESEYEDWLWEKENMKRHEND